MSNRTVSRRRARRAGLLATLLAALLTPAGTIIAGSATAALALGAIMAGKHLDDPRRTDPRGSRPDTAPGLDTPVPHGGTPGIVTGPSGGNLPVALHETAPGGLPQGAPFELAVPPAGSVPGSGAPYAMPRTGKSGPPGPGPLVAGPGGPAAPHLPPAAGPGMPSHPPAGKDDLVTPKPPTGTAPADDGKKQTQTGGGKAEEDTPDKLADDTPPQKKSDEEKDTGPGNGSPSLDKDPLLPAGTLPDTSGPGDTLSDSTPSGSPSTRQLAAVPEPSVIGLLLLGAAALFAGRRRRPAGAPGH
ncbi:PEP-CTERM sorting domain-containing protein [Betaproteobacteria bacterium SCN1]|jgi:hypothetical protein|nr:PEP-CTERM sorting domain-containing protein [Betaproteobacteria bacterium SCN1]MBN8760955.1 PEP-CTERM sorting domain-containing protein [Thiobacillus sp.]ODU90562.1 MAG: hypothetical protein ABT21_00470 [Thiobacillus sp. SCN 65-179]OJW36012.1 MAG: hypothetical protein BGO61_08730 [Thiobacillus sp. 65-69]